MSEPLTPECRTVLAGISAYLDGELPGAECAAIEEHCHRCPSCDDVVSKLRETIGLCRRAGRAPLPEPVRERARDAIRRLLDR